MMEPRLCCTGPTLHCGSCLSTLAAATGHHTCQSQSPLVSLRGGKRPVPRASKSILPIPSRLLLLLPLRTGLRGGTLKTASATSPNPAVCWYPPPKAGWLAARLIFWTKLLLLCVMACANWSHVLLPASPNAALLKLCRDAGAAGTKAARQ
jgi:hypothetical protein